MRKPSPSLVIALLALFVALGGPAAAAKLISGKKLKDNSVTSAKIRNRTLTADDMSRATLNSFKRTGTDVTSANIVDGTIQLADMGTGNVTGNQVLDHSLNAVDVAPDSLTGAEIATTTVGANELAPESVLNQKIKDAAVTKPKIAGDAVATDEVRDGTLTGKDVGKGSGTLAVTIGNVGSGSCLTQGIDVTEVDLTGTLVLVGAPIDGVIATARPFDADTVQVQVCNPTSTPVTSASGNYPFIAFTP